MVVEFLSFHVPRQLRERWLDVEQQTWSRFLAGQAGFVDKQLWVERDQPDVVHAVIRWVDEAAWKAIPEEQLAAVDAAMGPLRCDAALRVYDVLADVRP